MAFQIHRLFAPGTTTFSTSSHLPIMSQCKTLQNYPGICSQFSPFSNAASYTKCAQLRLMESRNLCGFTRGGLKNQRFKLERDSFTLSRSFGDYKQNFASTFNIQLQVKYSNLCTPSCLDRKLGVNFSSQQCARRRFFSVKASENSQTKKESLNVKDGKTVVSNISPKLSDRFKKGAKSFVVQSSSSCTQAVVSNQAVKKSASEAIVSVPNFLHVPKPGDGKIGLTNAPVKLSDRFRKQVKSFIVQSSRSNEQVGVSSQSVKSTPKKSNVTKPKNGKKDVKLESLSSTSGAKKKNTQSQGNQKQQNKKEKGLSGSTTLPGDAQVNSSKQASPTKKANGKQASEICPAGEESLTKVQNASVTHEKIKKIIGKPTVKRKSQKKVTVDMKSDKATTKVKSTPVPVEVKTRPFNKGLKSLYPPTGKSVVVVESLTKAKVIQGYLGDMFEVLPSYGHVRDLAGRSGSVRPDDDFSMVWEVPSTAWTHLKSIKVALNGADNLILASDPDREGEAIAWHITEMLQQQDALRDDINISRVVFHEITEQSIKSALQSPRDIDANLVHAYLARRALDYLIGFSISPLLWRKLPGCQSAGRVQSAALALICDREMEIDESKQQEYWTVEVNFNKAEAGSSTDSTFASRLTYLDFKKLEQLSISSCEEANAIEQKMTSSRFEVSGSKRSKTRRNPPAPYITSTLQQDAANKLNFPASYTMKLAQKLYEGVKLANDEATGLITYMRTDGLHISDVAAEDIRSLVIERYGHDFASESTRKYFKKVKNAQEAHEAIRPTSIRRLPSMLTGVLDEDSLNLYILIWSRTMACQMVPTVIDQIQIDISGAENFLGLRSTCSRIEFLGYEAVYKDAEAVDVRYSEKVGDSREEAFEVLAELQKGDLLNLGKVELKQHFTQPPSRYSEGSLVKKLEELGIGRPSTYASTIKVLQDRNYVTVKSRTLIPEFRGRMVSAFLSHHFSEVTDYSFTADMETELDNVSAGMTEWKGLIKDYWTRFKTYCTLAGNVEIRQVEKMLEKTFEDILFASLPNKSRTCPSCLTGTLIFKVSRFGSGYFLGCDKHPACKYIAKTIYKEDEDDENPQTTNVGYEPKVLGLHPTSNEKVLLKTGPFGSYVQLGEDRKGYSPKRASTYLVKDVGAITLEDALDLLQYPLLLGNHPEDGRPVLLKIARYGLSVRHRRTIAPVPKKLKPKDVTFEKALQLLLSKDAKQCGRPKRKPALEEVLEAAG